MAHHPRHRAQENLVSQSRPKCIRISAWGATGPSGTATGRLPNTSPPPLNFTTLRRNLVDNAYIGGIFYYQIMNGITGTAIPYFKRDLESTNIWDLANYLGASFLGYTDANIQPRGIDAAFEPEWKNTYLPPQTKGSDTGKPAGEKEK